MSLDPWKKKVDAFRSKFVARQDVFSIRTPKTVTVTDPVTGEIKVKEEVLVMPACANYGDQKVCLIAQRKGGCADCHHHAYKELTDKEVWKHLSGEQEIILFMLRQEGIRFGAADFDKGNTFEDAKAVRDLSVACGIPCHIAKSTKKGYHVYWFFSDFVKPQDFVSYVRYLFEELGFYQRWALTPEIGIPEVFPKQTTFIDNKIGNGIKVPMMEPRMKEGRNCWVDDNGNALSMDAQWAYIESAKMILPSDFAQMLVDKGVEILQAPASKTRQRARQAEGKEAGTAPRSKPFGDFWSVVEGCPSLQAYWGKDEKGNWLWTGETHQGDVPHAAYLASLMVAVATTNGLEEVKKRWPDSGTNYQVNYELENGYAPMSCKTMQENGVCIIGKHPKCGDHCMKKLAPVAYNEGVRVINPENLPEDQWPDPSPIRFATDRNLSAEDIIERLASIFKALKEKDKKQPALPDDGSAEVPQSYLPANPSERIRGLITRAKTFEDPKDYTKVRDAILKNKWMTAKEIGGFEKDHAKEVKETIYANSKKGSQTFKFGNNEYQLREGGYWRLWLDAKGERQGELLTNFYILIHEERAVIRPSDNEDLHADLTAQDRSFVGTVYIGDKKRPFNVNYLEWTASSDTFFRTLTKLTGSLCQYERCNYDYIRICINHFSQEQMIEKKVTREIGYHTLGGQPVYIMPSVVITKDVIKDNNVFAVDEFKDDASKPLDFKIIGEEGFKDLAKHIVEEYFPCNNSVLTMTTFAHAMAAATLPQITAAVSFNKSPILWLAGSQSAGKTFVAEAAQNFFGVFESNQNASGSFKSKLNAGHNFRHAPMLIDDYKKHLSDPHGKEFPQLIQMTYDRNGRTALQRNGQQREVMDRVRGLLMVTGEDVLESEASATSRMLTIDVPLALDQHNGKKVAQRRGDYCGFTPYYIQFVLGLEKAEIFTWWNEYFTAFLTPIENSYKSVNPRRVCENLTLNMLAFRIAMEMMAAKGAIPEAQRDELCRVHFGNLVAVRSTILSSVVEATGAVSFIATLRELLQNSAKFAIHNWPGYEGNYENKNQVYLGFCKADPNITYIFPKTAHGNASDLANKNKNHMQSIKHIARQLYDEGIMVTEKVDRSKGTYTVSVRGPDKTVAHAWPIRTSALGLDLDSNGKVTKRDKEEGGPLLEVIRQKDEQKKTKDT